MHPRFSEANERRRQRQEREDAAPRLATEVPNLATLRLVVSFHRNDLEMQPAHTRVVVVERAPALFNIPCADKECRDGGHDFTHEILANLRQKKGSFKGTAMCNGELGSAGARCRGELRYEATATYR